MTDLAGFLTARLDEDEAMWRLVAARPRMNRPQTDRMFREVAAKRAILADCEDGNVYGPDRNLFAHDVMHYLGAVYSDHPDYDPDWAM